jgi:hypothetical protein
MSGFNGSSKSIGSLPVHGSLVAQQEEEKEKKKTAD